MLLPFVKILVLLWLINFAPPLLAHFLGERWGAPLDGGRLFIDNKPIFGPHKTKRGLAAAIVTGWAIALFLGINWWIGLLAVVLSMAGDLLTSFAKRRAGWRSGKMIPGLDQVLEGFLPFLVLQPHFGLSGWETLVLAVCFCVGAYAGSLFFKGILLNKPSEDYPRAINSRVRLREFRSCQITSDPLHKLLNFEDAFYYHFIMKTVFRLLGIYEQGKRNALVLRKSLATFYFPDLPPSFDGYTILYLSDLHLDGLDGLTEKAQSLVRTSPADLCIIGGDLRMETHGPFSEALSRLRQLMPHIRTKDGTLGVLGNHDCLEFVDTLKDDGVAFIINDSATIERNGERIWFVGVDDPHYYKCHDLELAFKDVPEKAFTVFLAHSNEVYREASVYSPQLYLCGHTHGGQICVPPFGAVFTHSRAPRRLVEGPWKQGKMMGFTSSGVGVSGIPVRFRSRGEVLLLTLRRRETEGWEVTTEE
jgi:predicted MPP superfamily phosphohydrolase